MPLTELTVENLAVIERARLPISPGFTVLTGETGAGKSLVVDALALALGARAASDQVRSGTDAARVEAVFSGVTAEDDDPLADVLAAGEGMAIIRREVGADGRSVVRVNDRSVTVGGLATLGARLAEIHGQHEQQRLLAADRQLALLDRFGELDARVAQVEAAHRAWRAIVAQAAEMLTDEHELARRVELLRHQVDEIEGATLQPGERFHHRMPGGGGFGDPFERDPQAVARDVLDGKVSVEAARELYGVVVEDGVGRRLAVPV